MPFVDSYLLVSEKN